MKTIQTIALPGAVFSTQWSEDNRLLALTSKGIVVYELKSSKKLTSEHLDLTPTLLQNPCKANPALKNLRSAAVKSLVLEDVGQQHDLGTHLYGVKSSDFSFEIASWAPKLDASRPLIAALTTDNWLCIYEFSHHFWTVKLDLSSILLQTLKESNWKEIEQADASKLRISSKNAKIEELIAKLKILSFISFVWTPVEVHGMSSFTFLLTLSKSGHLIVWKVFHKASDDKVSASVMTITYTNVLGVNSLWCHEISNGSILISISSTRGILKVFKLKVRDRGKEIDLSDSGMLWDTPDNMRIRNVQLIKESKILRFALLKENFVILIDVTLSGLANTKSQTMIIKQFDTLISGFHQFSASECITICESGKAYRFLQCDSDLSEIILEECQSDIDCSNYQITSTSISLGKCIMIMGQAISAPYDHLVMRTSGRLVIQTLFSDPNEVIEFLKCNIPKRRSECFDALEVLRVFKVSSKGTVELSPEVNSSLKEECLDIWICQILGLTEKSNDIQKKKLCDHAKSLLFSKQEMNEQVISAMQRYIMVNGNEMLRKKISKSRKSTEFMWRCSFCGQGPRDTYESALSLACLGGHEWPLCVVTLIPCDTASVIRCSSCDAMAREEVRDFPDRKICVLCGGSFQTCP